MLVESICWLYLLIRALRKLHLKLVDPLGAPIILFPVFLDQLIQLVTLLSGAYGLILLLFLRWLQVKSLELSLLLATSLSVVMGLTASLVLRLVSGILVRIIQELPILVSVRWLLVDSWLQLLTWPLSIHIVNRLVLLAIVDHVSITVT